MRRRPSIENPQSVEDTLLRRARRHAKRGDERKAMLAAREACFGNPTDARLWAIYAFWCFRARRQAEALQALGQAIWFREQARDERRAAVLRRIRTEIESGVFGQARAA